jgi:hypothetical protein
VFANSLKNVYLRTHNPKVETKRPLECSVPILVPPLCWISFELVAISS